MNNRHPVLNEAQLQLLELVSVMNTKEELDGLHKVITDYLKSQLQDEMDKLWTDGTLTNEKVESFRTLHERTPYHKTSAPC